LKRRKINPFNRWKHCKNYPLVKFHSSLSNRNTRTQH